MKIYELTLVLTEEIGKDEAKQKKLVEKLLAEVKATVKEENILGVRDLAYAIKKQDKAWYGIFTIKIPKTNIPELDKLICLKEEILRHLLIAKE